MSDSGKCGPENPKKPGSPGKTRTDILEVHQLLRFVKSNNTNLLKGITGQASYLKDQFINKHYQRVGRRKIRLPKPVWRGREENDDGLLTITGLK